MTDPTQQSRIKNMTFVFDAADGSSSTLDSINRQLFRRPVAVENCTATVSGQMTIKDGVAIPPNTSFTAVWYPTVLDCPYMNLARFSNSGVEHLTQAVNPSYGTMNVTVQPGADPFQTRFGCPVFNIISLDNTTETHSQATFLNNHSYAYGVQLAGANLYSTVALCPDLNTVSPEIIGPTDASTFTVKPTIEGLTSFWNWSPCDSTNLGWNTENTPATIGGLNAISRTAANTNLRVSTINCMENTLRETVAVPGEVSAVVAANPSVPYIYGQGAMAFDWLEPNLSNDPESNSMPFTICAINQKYSSGDIVEGVGGASIINFAQNTNSTPAHQQSFVGTICGIYDATLNINSTLDHPIFFPINNSEESAFNGFFRGELQAYAPQIGNTFLPFHGITTANPGWPIPVSQITLNAPNGTLVGDVTVNDEAISPVVLSRPYSKLVNNSRYGPAPINSIVNAFITSGGTLKQHINWDFGMLGCQGLWGTYDFPHLYPPTWLTTQVGFMPTTFIREGTSTTDFQTSNTFLNELPSGGWAAQSSMICSYRQAFIFSWNEEKKQFCDIVKFTSKVNIPEGFYSSSELQALLSSLLQTSDAEGNLPFAKIIDFENGSYICVATDYINDTAPWRNPKNNTLESPNRVGPASAGHIGRGFKAFRPCNARMLVGSTQFSIALGGQGLFEFSGAFESYTPSSLLTSSGYTAGQPSSAMLTNSFETWIAPPVMGNYGYSIIAADGTPTATEIDPQFIQKSPTVAPFNLAQLSYQNLLFPNTVTRASAAFNKLALQQYQNVTQLLPGNTRGEFVQLISQETSQPQISLVRITNPEQYVPERLNMAPSINPWMSAQASGPTGLVLGSLCNGTEPEKNFWKKLGFNPANLINIWEPEFAYIQPVDGAYYNQNTQQYAFDHAAKCITNEAPWAAYTYPEWHWQSLKQGEGVSLETLANAAIAAIPNRPITFAINGATSDDLGVTATTNCPLYMTLPQMQNLNQGTGIGSIAITDTALSADTAFAYNNIPSAAFQLGFNQVSNTVTLQGAPSNTTIAMPAGFTGGPVVTVPIVDYFLYNLYNCHSTWPTTPRLYNGMMLRDLYNVENLSGSEPLDYIALNTGGPEPLLRDFPTETNIYNFLICGLVDQVGPNFTSMQIPGTCAGVLTSMSGSDLGTSTGVQSLLNTAYYYNSVWQNTTLGPAHLLEAVDNATMCIPYYTEFDYKDYTKRRPTRAVNAQNRIGWFYIEGLSERCQGIISEDLLPLVDGGLTNFFNNRFSRLISCMNTTNIQLATPAGCVPMITRAVQCLSNRIPMAGYCDVSRITSWILPSTPTYSYRGYAGLPTKPMMSVNVVPPSVSSAFTIQNPDKAVTPADAFATILAKLEHKSDVIPMVVNYDPKALQSLNASYPAGARSNISDPYGNLPQNYISIQPIIQYSGQDTSEAAQIPYTSQVWPASLPTANNEDLNKYGCVKLTLWNSTMSTRTDSYFNGESFSDSVICQIAPDSSQLQVIPFNSSETFELPAHIFNDLYFQLTTVENKEINGLINLRIFLQFTPTNQQTSLEAAFQNSADLSVLAQQAAPSVTQINPNAQIARPGLMNIQQATQPVKRAASEAFFQQSSGATSIPSFGVPAKRKPPMFF